MIKRIVRENYIYLILLAAFSVLFLILKNAPITEKIVSMDKNIMNFLLNNTNDSLAFVMKIFTFFGDWYVPIFIIITMIVFFKNEYYPLILSLSYTFVGGLSFLLKVLVARPRPEYSLILTPLSYSFPSGHTMTSLVFYLVFSYLMTHASIKRRRYIVFFVFIIIELCIAFSRLYLGVHYFSDVMCGIILGTICTLMSINIIEKNYKERL